MPQQELRSISEFPKTGYEGMLNQTARMYVITHPDFPPGVQLQQLCKKLPHHPFLRIRTFHGGYLLVSFFIVWN